MFFGLRNWTRDSRQYGLLIPRLDHDSWFWHWLQRKVMKFTLQLIQNHCRRKLKNKQIPKHCLRFAKHIFKFRVTVQLDAKLFFELFSIQKTQNFDGRVPCNMLHSEFMQIPLTQDSKCLKASEGNRLCRRPLPRACQVFRNSARPARSHNL